MKIQDVMYKVLIGLYIWMCFYLSYKDTFTEDPAFPDMLLYIIRFFTRPVEWIIERLFYA
jgi:hypothetical protein